MKKISSSELIIRDNGAIYHLGLLPEDVPTNVIVVGDPSRVHFIAELFDEIIFEKSEREFHSVKGIYKTKEVLVISSGISSDNVEILINELDALVNIDFTTREPNDIKRKLNIVRIGTCGGVSEDVALGDFILSKYAIGGDGVLNFYADSSYVRYAKAENMFMEHIGWQKELLGRPYFVSANADIINVFEKIAKQGITYCAGGFYAPQGRNMNLLSIFEDLPNSLSTFEYEGMLVCNIEMEGAALVGLAQMLGHSAVTICVVVAHRLHKDVNIDYQDRIKELVINVLDRI